MAQKGGPKSNCRSVMGSRFVRDHAAGDGDARESGREIVGCCILRCFSIFKGAEGESAECSQVFRLGIGNRQGVDCVDKVNRADEGGRVAPKQSQ